MVKLPKFHCIFSQGLVISGPENGLSASCVFNCPVPDCYIGLTGKGAMQERCYDIRYRFGFPPISPKAPPNCYTSLSRDVD